MPSAAATDAAYVRALSYFDVATITHGAESGTARARVFSETANPLSDAIQQSVLRAIVYAKDLGFVPERGDQLSVGGHYYVIQSVDDATRRVEGVVIAYQMEL